VIFHPMPGGDDLPDQRRVRTGPLADAEEAGARAECVQQVQHVGRHGRIGSVIEGEGHTAPGLWQAVDGLAEHLAARPHPGCGQQRVIGGHRPQHLRPPKGMQRRQRESRPMQCCGQPQRQRRAPSYRGAISHF
jgi:hypothetical protein